MGSTITNISMLSSAVVILCVAGLGHAQTIGFGGCSKKVTVKENFDIVKYMGTWYEYGSIPNTFQSGLKCVSATYTLKDNGMVTVYNKGIKAKDSPLLQLAAVWALLGSRHRLR